MTASLDLLHDLLARSWGVEGTLIRMGGEGETYRVDGTAGGPRVLKLESPRTSPELLEMEHAAARAVSESVAGVDVPRPVPRVDDPGAVATLDEPGRPSRPVRLLAWVDGHAWAEAPPSTPPELREAGRTLGRITRALAPLDVPAAHRTHRWDPARAGALRPAVPPIPDPDLRRLLTEAFALWSAGAEPWLDALPHGFLHGDLNDENVRVREGRIVGLLDFGDALRGPLVCDLAVALTYLVLEARDPLTDAAQILRGYHEIRPLAPLELGVLFPMICGRLAVSLTIAAERRRVDPGREAWFVTEAAARRGLERYLPLAPREVAERWGEAVGVEPEPRGGPPTEEVRRRRDAHLPGTLSVSYREPLHVVRGRGAYLVDREGRPHLDLYNNVCHVGHAHPRVVEAACRQMARLNTNTRYLYDLLPAYAERLTATLPPGLDRCFLVNSGTEANELALRLARAHTGRSGVVVLEGAYHGHSTTLAALSPYKFRGPGGSGRPPEGVTVLPLPDGYRGAHRGRDRATGEAYGRDAAARIAALDPAPGAFLAETLPSCGGQILPPPGYFETVFPAVREAGALCVLDEVQVGFGRVGSHLWAFERYGVVPDVVVLGKPMGNGHPLGAVLTTAAVADAFTRTGMEFFSTFGGNPVSCAVGLAVLDVLEEEELQARAARVGAVLLEGLAEVATRHPALGEVRGAGLFLGLEMVADPEARTPDRDAARRLVEALRGRRILTGTDGPDGNVVKLKPPMVVDEADAVRTVDAVEAILSGRRVP